MEHERNLPRGDDWLPMLELYCFGKIQLHGCKGLSDFTDDCLGFRMERQQLFIYGSNLQLVDYSGESAEISGKILRIEIVGR